MISIKKYLPLLSGVLLIFFFTGCDVIDNPVIDYGISYRADLYGPVPDFVPSDAPHQKVLLEDFTGHDCGNCPNGHAVAHEILLGDSADVAVVAVHAGSLAAPIAPDYPNDWTTPEGEFYLLTQVGVDAMPKGRVNRGPSAATVFSPSAWTNKVTEALALTPPVNIQIAANYVAADQNLNIHVNSQWFENLTGDYNLVILITESDIIAPQLWYGHDPEYIPEYEHSHMLRKSVSGATGLVEASNPTAGSVATISYTFPWNAAWVPENCEIVAFITEGENGKVLNVEKHAVVE